MFKWKLVPEKISEAMLAKGINARTLAKEAGLSEVSIYKAINGKTSPRNSTIKKICDALGIVDPSQVCERIYTD